MKTDWIETSKGKFTHAFITGLFAEACKNGKYIVFMATPTFDRRLWSELVTRNEFLNYSLKQQDNDSNFNGNNVFRVARASSPRRRQCEMKATNKVTNP